MLLYRAEELSQSNIRQDSRPEFRQVLMVDPSHFRLEYSINPFMKETDTVDSDKATLQWMEVKKHFGRLGYSVVVLPSQREFPDMVFAANQSFPFWKDGKRHVIMAKMRHEPRRGEVDFFRTWFEQRGYEISPPMEHFFEGNGDCLLHPKLKLVLGGYGARTQEQAYHQIVELTGYPVALLELVSDSFYHLDTCFTMLREDTVALLPSAFSDQSRKLIEAIFPICIELSEDECLHHFAGNAHCPNGKDVLLHPGAHQFKQALTEHGFRTHEVNTSEFMKSGGSVFCMKLMIF